MPRTFRNCGNCGKRFSTRLVKVYVFKLRYCPEKDCKGEMFSDNELKIHKCTKCGFIVKFDDEKMLGSMGVAMKGTSRNKKAAEAMGREGYEITKVLIPEKQHCQRCINANKIFANMIRKERKKHDLREIPKEEAVNIIRNAVVQKLQEQHKVEAAKRAVQMKKEAELRKSKSKEMCITPFNTVPANKKLVEKKVKK